MTLDIRAPEFWQLDRVDAELRRVYDICAGCRRCLPLCPSFKVMFDRLDVDAVDGDVEKLPAADVKEVVDLCYQCKLCFNHCPYTPPHRWAVDFPRLMLRARAADARAKGVTLQDRFLGNTVGSIVDQHVGAACNQTAAQIATLITDVLEKCFEQRAVPETNDRAPDRYSCNTPGSFEAVSGTFDSVSVSFEPFDSFDSFE